MQSIFSQLKGSRETVICKLCIALAALLFLLVTILHSIPELSAVKEKLDHTSLSGQEPFAVTAPYRETRTAVFYDHLPAAPIS